MQKPNLDPTVIFELFRGAHATELLTAAVAHFNVFGQLAQRPLSQNDLRDNLGLKERPSVVLFTALKAFGLLAEDDQGVLSLTDLARDHLVPGAEFDVGNYVGLAAQSPNVLDMVERLKTNSPAGADSDSGAAFIYRDGMASAMEAEESARHFTMALAGRAKNVAPVLAENVPMSDANLLVDVGGGTGIYSFALLQKNPKLRAIIVDRPEVLRIAEELANEYGVADRTELLPGDMFADPLPTGADVVLLSNILHDWDVPECRQLIHRCAASLAPNGRLLIHDVFLNDKLDGPLPIALYSASLFYFTEGRAYSAAEYRNWLTEAGLTCDDLIPTLIHCGVLSASRR
ncbi:MAG: methyltransferase [Planctomycetaceae bacterium]|nr:methyltransferase [Planctomycetaceae bacterium]